MNGENSGNRTARPQGSRLTRREALRGGLCGAAGVLLADRFAPLAWAQPQPASPPKAKAKSVIQVFQIGRAHV